MPESVEQLVQQLVDRANEGQFVDFDALITSYPQWADELRELLPVLEHFEKTRACIQPVDANRFDSEQGRKIANYEIGRIIGRGGMGVVYEARQNPLGRRVAIKLLSETCPSPTARERFKQESRIAASLHHTNIVPVFDAGEDNGQLYFAMQLIEGVSIVEWEGAGPDNRAMPFDKGDATLAATQTMKISAANPSRNANPGAIHDAQDSPRLSPPVKSGLAPPSRLIAEINLVRQVAMALQYAHEKGIWHRDVKPSNILVDHDANAWITDFGLARPSDVEGFTKSGDISGTLRYLAPERLKGQCDARSDIYSLGLLLMEVVTGAVPWGGLEGPVIINRLSRNESCPSVACDQLPTDLRLIIRKAISPYPEMRYSTAREFADDLENFVERRPISARPLSTLRNGYLWIGRNRLVASLGVAVLVALFAGTLVSSLLAWNWRNAAIDARNSELSANEEKNRAIKAENQAREESSNATGALRFLSGILQQTTPYSKSNQNLTARELLACVNDRLQSTPDLPPLVEMEVRHTLGTIYWGLGDFQLAETHLAKSLELARSQASESPSASVNIEYDLAMLYWLQSDFAKAGPLFAEVLAHREQLLGDGHVKTLEAVNGLGLIQIFRDQPEAAEKLFTNILDSSTDRPDENNAEEKRLLQLLRRGAALAFLVQEKYGQAEPLLRDVLKKHSGTFGTNHPETLVSRAMMATLLTNTERLREAEVEAEETWKLRQEIFGSGSPHTLTSAALLARVYLAADRVQDAIPIIESTVSQAAAGKDRLPPFTVQELGEVGLLLLQRERFEEAEKLLGLAYEITAKKFPSSWRTPYLQSALGGALAGQGRTAEAEVLLRSGHKMLIERQELIPEHSRERRLREVAARLDLLL